MNSNNAAKEGVNLGGFQGFGNPKYYGSIYRSRGMTTLGFINLQAAGYLVFGSTNTLNQING